MGWEAAPTTFLFALGNVTGQPLKLLWNGSGEGVQTSGCGLQVGGGNDLVAFCSHYCTPSTFTTIAPGYACASLQHGTLCGTPGAQYYSPATMEVYAVRHA